MNTSVAKSAQVAVRLQRPQPVDAKTVNLCRAVLKRHARSFSAAAVFLTPQMHDRAAIAYAFCRLVDDTVDEATSKAEAHRGLARIEAMLSGQAKASPIVAAYMNLCLYQGIGLDPARDLIEGARSDLGHVQVLNDDELFLYCYRVAGTVGIMMCGILGVVDRDARRHAIDLGIAMQLTNICRDVLEDADRARVYLPSERLKRHGVRATEVAMIGQKNGKAAPSRALRLGVAQVVEELLDLAERHYASAARGLRYIPRRPRLAICVARALYREIGETLRARGCDPLSGRVHVSGWKRFTVTVQSAMAWFIGVFRTKVGLSPAALPGRTYPK